MTRRRFPDVAVVLPDPRLPDATKVDAVFSAEDLESLRRLRAALCELEGYRFEFLDDHAALLQRLAARPPAFALNLCDTGFRNVAAHELHVAALLEVFRVPYSGSPPACLAMCFDKAAVHAVAASSGIPVPRQQLVRAGADPGRVDVELPALVKPNRADGGLGITARSVARTRDELDACIARLRGELPDHDLLVQEFLEGEEYGVGLVGNPGRGFTRLPILEVDWSGLPAELPRVLGYESKAVPGSPYWTEIRFRPARLDPKAEATVARHAEVLFERLGCRDYARFDFRADAGGAIRLLEVNPNPAWCWDGKLAFMAGFADLSYTDLLAAILDAAERRWAE